MLIIQVREEQVTWDSDNGRWVSADPVIEGFINKTIPLDVDTPYDVPFRNGGMEQFVLDAARQLYPDLKIIVFEPIEPPEEIDGVVY